MFSVLSRGGSRVRHAYICPSCIRNLDSHLPLLSNHPSRTSKATFSATQISQKAEENGDSGKNSEDTVSGATDGQDRTKKDGNPKNSGEKSGKAGKPGQTKEQKRMVARRKERLLKLRQSSPDAPFKMLLKLYRAELEKDALKKGTKRSANISDSEDALAALKLSMIGEEAELGQAIKDKNAAAKSDGKGDKSEKTTAKKTKQKSPPPSNPSKDENKVEGKKKSKQSKDSKNGSKSSKENGKQGGRDEKAGQSTLKPKTKKKVPTGSNAIARETSQKRASSKPSSANGSKSKDGSPIVRRILGDSNIQEAGGWAKRWVDTIAGNREGGSGLKRAILLELIEKGNLSPEDVGPAVVLLRNAIQEDFKKSEFQSLKQAMQGSVFPASASSLPRLKKQTATGKSTLMSATDKLKTRREAESGSLLKSTTKREIMTINASDLKLTPLDTGPLKVPKLSYGLERVLFNPGVYQLQDPRSRVFNFDPYLQTIMPVSEFDFSALKQYITSSRDTTLLDFAKQEKKKYTGSTSSMTSALGHFHFLLSQWRPINATILSKEFPVEFSSFTLLQRGPTAIFLRYKNGTYAIDADKEFDTANILSSLGKSMEKLLTLPTDDFERYRKPNSSQITEEERNEDEAFHYTTMGDFLMRSQLDAYDPRLPGTGMFDLKTRAVVAIRMDTSKYEEGSGYEIKSRYGEWESYEREYYDMIRAAFLKYSLQVRMGRMDGIFVAFHNTERIFGFQYVSLSEMDYALHGTHSTNLGDAEFKLSVELLNRVLDRATAKYPEKSLRLFFETREADTPFMYIFAEPVEETEIDKIQTTNKAGIEEFESRVLGLVPEDTEEQKRQEEWDSLHSIVEQEMDKDEVETPVEDDTVGGRFSGSEHWDEETRQKVEDFVTAAAQENSSQDDDAGDEEGVEEEEDEGEEEEDGEGDELDTGEEESNKDDDLVEGNDAEENDEFVEDQEQEEDDDSEGNEDIEEAREEDRGEDTLEETSEQVSLNDASQQRLEGESEFEFEGQQQELTDEQIGEGSAIEGQKEMTQGLSGSDSTQIQAEEADVGVSVNDETDLAANLKQVDAVESADDTNAGAAAESDNTLFTYSKELPKVDSASQTTDTASTGESDNPSDEVLPADNANDNEPDVFAMTLTIRNKVNDQYLKRPKNLLDNDNWEVEYSLAEIDNPVRAAKLYEMAKARRSKTLSHSKKSNSKWNGEYVDRLMKMAKKGREWRQMIEEEEKWSPKKVLVVEPMKAATTYEGLEGKETKKDE